MGGRAAGGELPQLCLWAQEAAKGCASGMQEGHGYAQREETWVGIRQLCVYCELLI